MHGRTPCDSVGKKEKKRKKEHIAEGKEERKKKTFSSRRSHTLACNVNAFVSWCANAHDLDTLSIYLFLSHWHLHCTFPCVATNAPYKTYSFFYVQKRNCAPPEINARRTIVMGLLCCAFPLLTGNIIKRRLKLHRNMSHNETEPNF